MGYHIAIRFENGAWTWKIKDREERVVAKSKKKYDSSDAAYSAAMRRIEREQEDASGKGSELCGGSGEAGDEA